MYKLYSILFIVFAPFFLAAQMVVGSDTLYGNEWIEYDQPYYKIPVAKDGLYRLSGAQLASLGIAIGDIDPSQYQVFHLGKEIPIHVSTMQSLGSDDYITFVGKKNRSELEKHLFIVEADMLHPNYSLFTDTSAYFLTIGNGVGLRYENVVNDVSNPPAPEPYFWRTITKHFHDYWGKKEGANGVKFSHFDLSEGFSTSLKVKQNHVLNPISVYLGPDATLKVNYSGRGSDHHQEISIADNLVTTDEFFGWQNRKLSFPVTSTIYANSFTFKMNGLANSSNQLDRSRISMLSLTYPQQFDFENKKSYSFILESNSDQYLSIDNFNSNPGLPVLYDANNMERFEAVINNGLITFLLPKTNNTRDLVLSSGDLGLFLGEIKQVQFIDYSSANSDYLIITESRLMEDANSNNPIQDYADYRSSIAGGGYNTLIVKIQQVYDQFGYGIQRNPIGIRNMTQWVAREWENERFLYLIGKGRNYIKIRTSEAMVAAQSTMLIPTFGSPGGDNLFATSNFDSHPKMAISRLAVTTPDEVTLYLNKVMDLESNKSAPQPQTIANQAWKKKVIHLGGGAKESEKNSIKGHLNSMRDTIGSSPFCAKTVSFFKDVNDPIQQTVPIEIFKEINEGAALITIFGHSSPGSFDFNIDNPDAYNNAGRYPILTSLGCYSGDMFAAQKGISERFCLYDQKGAIGFVASSSVGYLSVLGSAGRIFYQKIGSAPTIGEGLKELFIHYEHHSPTSEFRRLSEQLMLNGDPAIQLGVGEGPDYVIDNESVDFGQATISSRQDSISVSLSIINIGLNYKDSVSLKLTHVLPNGQTFFEKRIIFLPQGFETKINYIWKSPNANGLGQNKLLAEIDVLQEVTELPTPEAELNNKLINTSGMEGLVFYISDNSIVPIEPREFAIKNKADITLIASTTNAFAKETTYLIQLDTTEQFNSSLLETTTITQIGGLVKWKPTTTWLDTTVYYWRITPDSISVDLGYLWSNSSFITTIDTIEGWNQSHFYQFKKDKFEGLIIERDKDLAFTENGFFITIKNKVYSVESPPEYIYNYGTLATSVQPWNYIDAGIAVVVGDQYTGGAWANSGGEYGSTSTSFSRVFPFSTNTITEREKLINFIENVIPDGDYVWLFSVLKDNTQDFSPELWGADSLSLGANLFSVLESEGAIMIRNLEAVGSMPYAIAYRKGKGVISEDIALGLNETIVVESFIPIKNVKGVLQSKEIGPAIEWLSVEWGKKNFETNDTDTLSLWGLNAAKTDTTLLFDNIEAVNFSLSSIDAQQYPFVILRYSLMDEMLRSAPDLDFWKVHFKGLPELAVNPNTYFKFHAESLAYGDLLKFEVALENISDLPMDSILVNLKVTNTNNQSFLISQKWAPLTAYDVDTINYSIPTTDLFLGSLSLSLEANPNEDQAEFFHGNNFGLLNFTVIEDTERPVLEVFFDGVRIIDGDLISAKPEIIITLDDENKYFQLVDTSLFRITLVYPDQDIRRVFFTDPLVEFKPAQTQLNVASIIYTPNLAQDGNYELIVEAKDASGNASGAMQYKISFNIINKKMISNVLPYPNPFSTSTRFAYTLTGDATPEVFKIQILSINGSVVREITQDEIGPLRVGRHLTNYEWDGRDEYGDLLANGVYLYRLIVKDEEQEVLEVYQTNADSFFDKSFGKMVILR